MPTYEYRCEACGQHFERFQRPSVQPIRTCPSCGGAVCRVIGAGGGVIYKGSTSRTAGWMNGGSNCRREQPCCGRQAPCDRRPCE